MKSPILSLYKPIAATRCLSRSLTVLFIGLLLAVSISAQTSGGGGIRGVVSNNQTSEYLEGALVELLGTDQTMLTSRSGAFEFGGLAAGAYRLRISYTGLDTQTITVDVESGRLARADVLMTSEVYTMEVYRVTGSLEGNAAALTLQKNAANVVNIVAMDAYGTVADGNIGNFLQRLPGIDTTMENGEVNGFGIRGLPQALSTVSMDGEMLPAASTGSVDSIGDRSYPIDNMPAELISNLMVTKSPTADMSADSLGGNVNLKSKSALDFSSRRILYRAGMIKNLNRHGSKWTPSGSFSYMERIGEFGNTGITITGSYSEVENTSDRLHHKYTPVSSANSSAVQEPFMMNVLTRLLDDTIKRTRMGGSVKLEHRFGDNVHLYVMGTYTRIDYNLDRFDHRLASTPANLKGTPTWNAPVWDDFVTNPSAPLNIAYKSDKLNEMYRVNAGGEIKFGKSVLNFKLSHGDARSSVHTNTMCATYSRTISTPSRPLTMRVYGGREKPHFEFLNVPSGVDLFSADSLAYYSGQWFDNDESVRDLMDQCSMDWKVDKPFDKKWLSFLKAGAAFRIKDYRLMKFSKRYHIVNPERISGNSSKFGLLSPFARGDLAHGLFDGYYQAFPTFDVTSARDYYTPYLFRAETGDTDSALTRNGSVAPVNSNLKDKVSAAYIMGDIGYKRLWLVAGVRMEHTQTTGRGNSMSDAQYAILKDYLPDNFGDPRSVDRDFTNWFPSLHLRYHATNNLILRASWSKSMGRPAISKQTPLMVNTSGNTDDDEDPDDPNSTGQIQINNTGLRPMYANNYDLSAEYYFSKAGVVSFGLFAKDMKGYIYSQKKYLGDNAAELGEFNRKTIKSQWNMADTAKIRGLEMNYSQVLTFLPAFLKHTRLMLNCTYQSTSGKYGDSMKTSDLVGFKPFLANAGLMFKFNKFEALIFFNYQKEYLAGLDNSSLSAGTRRNETFYIDESMTVDLNLKYTLKRYLTVFVDITNLFNNTPNSYLLEDKELIRTHGRNGARISMGISGRF